MLCSTVPMTTAVSFDREEIERTKTIEGLNGMGLKIMKKIAKMGPGDMETCWHLAQHLK